MPNRLDSDKTERYRSYLKAELGAAAVYTAMAQAEKDPKRAEVFERLVQAEMRHASRWAERLGLDSSSLRPADAGLKLRVLQLAAKILGTGRIVPWLLRGEAKDVSAYAADPEARDLAVEERRHARVLRELSGGGDGLGLIKEGGQFLVAGGGLRAAVLGVNDGLVSNFSLVMGVAGGTGTPEFVLLAGVAGLLAGAFSMAAGEYVSMRSQRDLYEHRIDMERAELEEWPEEEEEELVLIYQAKGFSQDEAAGIAKQIMSRPQVALDTMAREELGSPWGAAISSFVAFVAGAIVPVLPYIFDAGGLAFTLSAVLSAAALALVGATLAGVSGKNIAWGGARMLLLGGAAAAATYGIGRLVGQSIVG